MSEPVPTGDDVKLARKVACWAGAGLEIFRHKLATEFARVRADEREGCIESAKDHRHHCPHCCGKAEDAIRARGVQ